MNLKGTYTVSALTLREISDEWLPKKFDFQVSGRDISISRKDFSFTCQAILIDEPKSLSSKHFLACITRKEQGMSFTLLCTDIDDEKIILADHLSGFFYTDEMLSHGFLAIKSEKKNLPWKLFHISAEHKNLTKPDGVSDKILKMLFAGTILWSSRLLVFNNKTYIIARMENGINILDLENEPLRLLEKDVNNIEVLFDQLEPPDCNCSYYQCAIRIYERLIQTGIKHIVIVSDQSDKSSYFNFVEKRYLSPKEEVELKENVGKYKEELRGAKEFDYLE